MHLSKSLLAVGLGLFAAGCSTESKTEDKAPDNKAAPELSDEERQNLEEEYAQIPQAAIVRVPVDVNGNATGEPEMRIFDGAAEVKTDAAIEAAFAEGQAPAAMIGAVDELDGDSSTQSWTSYQYCKGYSYGRCGYNNYTHNYWQSVYRPRLHWKGYTWNYGYGRPRYTQRGNYRYYCYNRYRYW